MKTAVSIPDWVFEKAERLARHAPDEVTEAMNRVCDEIGDQRDSIVGAAARRFNPSRPVFTRRNERLHLVAQRQNLLTRRLAEISIVARLPLLERTR
jgi:hypothetical protein